jgi:histidinol dehydrogenase
VYAVGGAQAVGAMAYGTETIRPVDVIVGPGNVYVAIAKREVAGLVGVPSSFPGPSEVVVIADDTAPVDLAAVDVILQAEHGPGGLAWLISWSEDALNAICAEIEAQVAVAPRRDDITATFAEGGYAVLCDSPEQAVAVSNTIAPEHLELITADPEALVPSGAPRRRGVLRARGRRRRWATTSPAPATCCPPTARPGSVRRSP